MVKRINKRVHIEKNQLLLYQGGVMTMLIMGTGVVYLWGTERNVY